MNWQEINDLVTNYYGLKFVLAAESPQHIKVLIHPVSNRPFVIASQDDPTNIDVYCGNLGVIVQHLPQFSVPKFIRNRKWIGVSVKSINEIMLQKVLNYSLKHFPKNSNHTSQEQAVYLPPDEKANPQYRAQQIQLPVRPQPAQKQEKSDVPAAIQKMIQSYDYTVPSSEIVAYNFYHQGQMMADYEDHYDAIYELKRYFPVYHELTIHQLRTYFTWRTRLRQEHFQVTSTSYAYLYIYELLNNIGVASPEEGYAKLIKFRDQCAPSYHSRMRELLDLWLYDYVLYYGLDRQKARTIFAKTLAADQDYHILLHPADYSSEQLLAVFKSHSTYLKSCLLFKKSPKQFAELLKVVWQQILNLRQTNQFDYFSQAIATLVSTSHTYFRSAVFYFQKPPRLKTYQIDADHIYHLGERTCSSKVYYPVDHQGKKLNTLLHEVDRLARKAFHFGHPLKPRQLSSLLQQAIMDGIMAYQQIQEEKRRPRVTLNLDSLDKIRTDASLTRESLLTEEEKEAPAEPKKKTVPQPSQEPATPDNQSLLNTDETMLIVALLKNRPWQQYLKDHHLMVSILVDQINEKLLDEIGDTVIEFNADNQPVVVEDYRQDLEQLFLS
ncbi:TerB N-terminal domain-containing protein [Lentilactobacillus raoultii]|uniref:TerB N-terminal domain-containing protein n=1 Tax=Lentilactobacillus raoultii TaxID=1987503 RepID=A0ABW3PQN5_9LACO|nr:TerB N-terminal domain-containing protein [Lentilactobacillus raoultii]